MSFIYVYIVNYIYDFPMHFYVCFYVLFNCKIEISYKSKNEDAENLSLHFN